MEGRGIGGWGGCLRHVELHDEGNGVQCCRVGRVPKFPDLSVLVYKFIVKE